MANDKSVLTSDVSPSYWKIFPARYSFYVDYYYWMDSMSDHVVKYDGYKLILSLFAWRICNANIEFHSLKYLHEAIDGLIVILQWIWEFIWKSVKNICSARWRFPPPVCCLLLRKLRRIPLPSPVPCLIQPAPQQLTAVWLRLPWEQRRLQI